MKKKNKSKNIIGISIVILLIGLSFYFAVYQSVVGARPRVDHTRASLITDNNQGATYLYDYEIYDPTQPAGCGCACSYDYTIQWHPKSQSASPPFVEGIVQGEWFEGTVTTPPSYTMIYNYASDLERRSSAIVNNTKMYCQVQQSGVYASLICRFTGDIYAKDGNSCGHVYGDSYNKGEVTIPTQQYLDTLASEEANPVTEIEIAQEVTHDDVIDVNQPDGVVDGITPYTREDSNKLFNILTGIVFGLVALVVIFVLIKSGRRKK